MTCVSLNDEDDMRGLSQMVFTDNPSRWKTTRSTITRTKTACDREKSPVQALVSPWNGRPASSATAPLTAFRSRRPQLRPRVFKQLCEHPTASGDFPSMGRFPVNLNRTLCVSFPILIIEIHQNAIRIRTVKEQQQPSKMGSTHPRLDSCRLGSTSRRTALPLTWPQLAFLPLDSTSTRAMG